MPDAREGRPPSAVEPPVDPDAFHRVFEECREPVFRFLWRLCRDPIDAEDLLQDTFVAYWRKGHNHDGRGPVLAYLRRTAWHLYLNQRTRRQRRAGLALRRPPRPASVPPVVHDVARADAQDVLLGRVRRAVDALPDAARETFVLHRYEGLDCREIAALAGVGVKTIESRLRRATRALASALAPEQADVGREIP